MPEYTALAVAGVVVTLLVELLWLRTRILRRAQFWLALAVTLFFQVIFEGVLTRRSAPVFVYPPAHVSGLRFPWNTPMEDYLFGFCMITVTVMLWVHAGRRSGRRPPYDSSGPTRP